MTDDLEYRIDASLFQHKLAELAEVLAQKVRREAPKLLAATPVSAPPFVAVDLHVLTRQAICTYNLLFYLNADERRETDCYWKNVYTIVTLPLIRNMIDCLYNITTILQDPKANGSWFRKSGFKKALDALNEDSQRYGGQAKCDGWIDNCSRNLDLGIQASGLPTADVMAQTAWWPTMGNPPGI